MTDVPKSWSQINNYKVIEHLIAPFEMRGLDKIINLTLSTLKSLSRESGG